MNLNSLIKKVKLKTYLLSKRYSNELPLFKDPIWDEKYFSYTFKNIRLNKILMLENENVLKRYKEIPYMLCGKVKSKDLDKYTMGDINDENIDDYFKEVDVKDIKGEDCGQGNTITFDSIEEFLRKGSKKVKTLNNYTSYYYLFNMTNNQFRNLFINNEINNNQTKNSNIGMNTVYLLEKNQKYYVTINGTHRVLFAKLIGIEKIKAVVFKAD
ncbi:hypothetical protein ACSBQ8_04820 [Staphylococcus equorum]|uniref:hypothetical protein n=1 Tax=Staphylococcus equorum TaxID=246432 RepID=UPI003EBCEDCA